MHTLEMAKRDYVRRAGVMPSMLIFSKDAGEIIDEFAAGSVARYDRKRPALRPFPQVDFLWGVSVARLDGLPPGTVYFTGGTLETTCKITNVG